MQFREFLSSLYFNSLDDREKVFSRLQFDIAISITLCAPAIYMLRMMDYESNPFQLAITYTGIILWFAIFAWSIYVIANAITGFEYKEFSDTIEVSKFRNTILDEASLIKAHNRKYNQNIPFLDADIEVEKFKDEQLEEIVSHNRKVNNTRRAASRRAIGLILAGLPPLLMSGTVFILYDLDTSSPRKNAPVHDTNLANAVKSLNSRIEVLQTNQRRIEMTNENDKHSSNPSDSKGELLPPKPQKLPPKPQPIIAAEDFKEKINQGKQILNENTKK